jgi:hypothetical protein
VGLIETQRLVAALCPPLDRTLAGQLVDEFVSAERRYIQCDWEPAELDGGQFCEILGRVLYHQDAGNLSYTRDFSDCCSYIEDLDGTRSHLVMPRPHALHIVKVLRTIYKFRSARGAVHISPTYRPNHMDSKMVIECVRWCVAETLRIFWNSDREEVARVIRELLQFEVPCIGSYNHILLVQRTDLTTEEEILLLLHHAGEAGMTRRELGRHVRRPALCANVSETSDLREFAVVEGEMG